MHKISGSGKARAKFDKYENKRYDFMLTNLPQWVMDAVLCYQNATDIESLKLKLNSDMVLIPLFIFMHHDPHNNKPHNLVFHHSSVPCFVHLCVTLHLFNKCCSCDMLT